MAVRKGTKPSESPQEAYEEERVPFDQVLRKLVSAKPAHKAAPAPIKRGTKKPPRKL